MKFKFNKIRVVSVQEKIKWFDLKKINDRIVVIAFAIFFIAQVIILIILNLNMHILIKMVE
jgi:hypothetical protein